MTTNHKLILTLRRQNLSDAQIATRLGLTRQRIGAIAGPSGSRPGPKGAVVAPERIAGLREAGATYREIGQLTGACMDRIRRVLREKASGAGAEFSVSEDKNAI